MNEVTFQKMKFNLSLMKQQGNQPIDCLIYATSKGIEYADSVWLVTRLFSLDDDAVLELEQGKGLL